jgi:hypothetical protein
MNEKLIQKLYQESLARRNTEWGENVQFFDYRKFAKLIIDECVEVIDPTWGASMVIHEPNRTIVENVKEHFGIE